MALGWEWRRYESQETSLGLSFLISKDGGWARQTPRLLAILTVCGWAYGKHPVTVTIREPARCLINRKRWSGALHFGRIICSPLQWRHPTVKD